MRKSDIDISSRKRNKGTIQQTPADVVVTEFKNGGSIDNRPNTLMSVIQRVNGKKATDAGLSRGTLPRQRNITGQCGRRYFGKFDTAST